MGSASAVADEEGRKVFLGGVTYDCREDDLRQDFGKYGELEDVQLPMGDQGRHKGFAFLTYRKAEDAEYAVKKHHQLEYQGREISAKIVVPRDRGGGGGGGGRGGGGGSFDSRPGDWTCPACGANVFGSKSSCFKCNEPKPRTGGREDDRYGGGGRDDDRYGGGRRDDRYDDRRRDDRYDDRRRDDRHDDRRRDDRHDDRRRDDRYDDRRRDDDRYDRRDDRDDDRRRDDDRY